MYQYFENLIKPFPPEHPKAPPKTLYSFCRHYARGTEPFLIAMALLTGAIAVMEVSLFGFLGKLVDWLNTHTPQTFWASSHHELLVMGAIVLIGLPITVLLHGLVMHQTLLGNFPMRIRWQAHRYLLGQSYQFYQNEFAGRVATKVMQTALAVRETIMKLLDVLLYVFVYFSGILVLLGSLDLRLALPLIVWFLSYAGLLYYFLPRLAKTAMRQADARSDMTGRLVDTYTNISTVKLFSHSNREAEYAKQGMEYFLSTVHPQMRLATALSSSVWAINAALIFAVAFVSIWLWSNLAITTGAIAAAIGLVLRLNGMAQWIMWEVSALFENIGTAKDGLNTLSIPREVQDVDNAKSLTLIDSHIQFEDVNFNYGKGEGLISHFNLDIRSGEKLAWLVVQVQASQPLLIYCCAFTTLRAAVF